MTSDVEDTETSHSELEAEALVNRFNDAKSSHSPELEWFGMSFDRETDDQLFVFEATEYIDRDGLSALRESGCTIRYIEAYEFEGDVNVQIEIPCKGGTVA